MISRKMKQRVERSVRKKLLKSVEARLRGKPVVMIGDNHLSHSMKAKIAGAARGRDSVVTKYKIVHSSHDSLTATEDVELTIYEGDKIVGQVYLHTEIPNVPFYLVPRK